MASKKTAAMLTVAQTAERIGASERSVRLWAKEGRFPGAYIEESPAGQYWLIPERALAGFQVRGRGRPPKAKGSSLKVSKKKGTRKARAK